MLDDRDYMRQPEPSGWRPGWRFRFQWSWTTRLLAFYLAVFLTEQIANHFYPANLIFNNQVVRFFDGNKIIPGYLPLSLEGIEKSYVWQLVSYQFLHADWLHLAMNCWMIFIFGRELESLLGAKKYFVLLFSSGMVGGVFQVLAAWVWPHYFGGAVVGASACAYGLTAAFTLMHPNLEMELILVPIRIRAKAILIGLFVLEVAGFAFPDVIMPGVGHVAHLGGMAMGWFYVRNILRGDWPRLEGFLYPAEQRPASRSPVAAGDETKPDLGEEQVNAVLDKISAQGIGSLTRREREILEEARKRMGKK